MREWSCCWKRLGLAWFCCFSLALHLWCLLLAPVVHCDAFWSFLFCLSARVYAHIPARLSRGRGGGGFGWGGGWGGASNVFSPSFLGRQLFMLQSSTHCWRCGRSLATFDTLLMLCCGSSCNFDNALDATLWKFSCDFEHAFDATSTLWKFSWNFEHALDAMLWKFSCNFEHALDATLWKFSCSFQQGVPGSQPKQLLSVRVTTEVRKNGCPSGKSPVKKKVPKKVLVWCQNYHVAVAKQQSAFKNMHFAVAPFHIHKTVVAVKNHLQNHDHVICKTTTNTAKTCQNHRKTTWRTRLQCPFNSPQTQSI